MDGYICVRCGVQHAEAAGPPARCAICEDEREAVFRDGQQWTTPADLRRDHRNNVEPREPGLVGIRTEPRFAIGQQALLIQTPKGNVLWDFESDRRRDRRGRARCGRTNRDRKLAPTFLRCNGRVEPSLWGDPGLPSRRRPRLGYASGPGGGRLGGRNVPACSGSDPRPLRGALCRLDSAPLARGRRGTGGTLHRRHAPRGRRPPLRHVHVQLRQLHPSVGSSRPTDHQAARPIPLRSCLRVLRGVGGRTRRAGRGSTLGYSVPACDRGGVGCGGRSFCLPLLRWCGRRPCVVCTLSPGSESG